MAKTYINGYPVTGSTSYASAITYVDKDGNKSTVQEVLDEQNKNMGGLRFGVDGDGNYGYYGADDSLIPFKSGLKAVGIIGCGSSGTYVSNSFINDSNISYEKGNGWFKFTFNKKMTVNLKSIGIDIAGNTSSNGSIDINGSNIISNTIFGSMNIDRKHTFNSGDYIRVVSATCTGAGSAVLVIY